jgi:NADH:ubiquinone oxidoreductase subunit C
VRASSAARHLRRGRRASHHRPRRDDGLVRREHLLAVARALRSRPAAVRTVHRASPASTTARDRRELHAVYHFLSITNDYNRIRSRSRAPTPTRTPVDRLGLPGQRLARAARPGDMFGIQFDGPPGPHPDPHAGRLARPPAAQGLPARRHPRRVQGRDRSRRPTSAGATTDDTHRILRRHPGARPETRTTTLRHAGCRRVAAEGASSSTPPAATGDDLVDEATRSTRSGSSSTWDRSTRPPTACSAHPRARRRDGDRARAGIGYLHTGIEKNMEFRNWTQGVTFCTRMDYLTRCAGGGLLPRPWRSCSASPTRSPSGRTIRVLMMELTRISSHLVALGTGGWRWRRRP